MYTNQPSCAQQVAEFARKEKEAQIFLQTQVSELIKQTQILSSAQKVSNIQFWASITVSLLALFISAASLYVSLH